MSGADEFSSHSFVIRLWLEESRSPTSSALWRGHITHIPSGTRRYVQQLSDVPVFIAPYLEQMGVRMGIRWAINRWLSQWWNWLKRWKR